MVAGETDVGSEVQRWEAKESLIPKTKGRQLVGFLYSKTKSHSVTPPSLGDNQRT